MDRYLHPPAHGAFLATYLMMFFFMILFFGHSMAIAFAKMGLSPYLGLPIFALSLAGSLINIPVKRVVSRRPIVRARVVSFMGIRYVIPYVEEVSETVIAVNVGGAVIPVLLSSYLIWRVLASGQVHLLAETMVALLVVTAVSKLLARPVPGLGIAMPAFVPPLTAALTAILLDFQYAPIIAYVSGTLGVLIGADLMNLHRIPELGATVASIGGAGTFDGIFLSGLIAALLA